MKYSLRRATIWNLLGYIYLFILSFATTPAIIRALGIAEFGQYVLALAILSVISSLDLGLSRALIYYLAQPSLAQYTRSHMLSTGLILFVLLGLFFTIPTLLWHSFALAMLVFATFLLSYMTTLKESQGQFGWVNLRSFSVGTANTVGALLMARAGYGLMGVIWLLTGTTLLTSLLLFRPFKFLPDFTSVRSLLTYGLYNQLGKLVGQLQSQYAKFLLATSPLALVSYSLGSSLISRSIGGITQMSAAFFPRSVYAQGNLAFRRLYVRVQLCLSVLGIVTIILYQFFGLAFLTWWLTDRAMAETIHSFLLVYRFYGFLLLLTPLASTVVDSLGYPGMTSLFGLIALLIELIVAFILYPQYGLLAPAYAGLISLGIMTPLFLLFTKKILSHAGNGSQTTHA